MNIAIYSSRPSSPLPYYNIWRAFEHRFGALLLFGLGTNSGIGFLNIFLSVENPHQCWSKHESACDLIMISFFSAIFSVTSAIMLLRATRQSKLSHSAAEVIFPLLVQFFPFIPMLTPYLPSDLTTFFVFSSGAGQLTKIFGTLAMILGIALAVSGLVALGRNFSITVSVNQVIRHGPYRFMKHPMYCGQCLAMFGYCILFPNILNFLSLLLLGTVQVARAQMENRYFRQ